MRLAGESCSESCPGSMDSEQFPCVCVQDPFLVLGRQIQAVKGIEDLVGLDPGMVAAEEQFAGIAEIDRESHRFRKRRDDVHVDRSQVLAGFALQVLRTSLENV